MPGIPVHVVDVSRGTPAPGLTVEVFRIDAAGARVRVGGGRVGHAGLVDDAGLVGDAGMGRGDCVAPGTHDVALDAGAWFRAQGIDVGSPALQERTVYRFELVDVAAHLHLPFKLSPRGVSAWRGTRGRTGGPSAPDGRGRDPDDRAGPSGAVAAMRATPRPRSRSRCRANAGSPGCCSPS